MVVVIALTIGVGTLIGTEIGHKRAADRVKAQAERSRAADAAEARREREETRREREDKRREREQEAPDKTVEDVNDALLRAAKAGRREAVARQEATLDQLSRRREATEQDGPTPKDPYEREIDRFPITQRPLFAQQIGTNGDDHVLYVSVFKAHFCLKSERERREAVRKTYAPIARRLRQRKIDDFELLVVPLSQTAPRRSAALARATNGSVALTSRGRSCRRPAVSAGSAGSVGADLAGSHRLFAVRNRLRPARPCPAARAVGRGDRLPAVVRR